jgi:rhodanese-related sulfurtransferase
LWIYASATTSAKAIAGSTNLLPSEIKANNFGELENTKTNLLLWLMVQACSAQDSATALIKAGFEQVSVLKDGVAGWSGENLPLVRGK